jgi:leader peptidase (prepilin peptidase) / N-methyltransferase
VWPLTVGCAAVAGAVAGAFLPRPAYRLSVAAGAAPLAWCRTCGADLPPGSAGWLRLPSACTSCGARLGPASWLTATAAGVACGLVAAALGPVPALPLYAALAVLGVLLAAIDLACKRLPDPLVLPAVWASGAVFVLLAAADRDWGTSLRAVEGAAVLGGVFLVLALLPGAGMGYGDVKLAVLLGLYLGWLGWGAVILGGLLPWLLNGPVVLALLLAGRLGRKSTVPFGPAMLVGALAAVVCFAVVARW